MLRSGLSKALFSALIGLLFVVSPAFAKGRYSHYVLGDLKAATPSPVSGGLLLMGGGDRNHDSMRWFFGKAGHGHIVILRASMGPEIGKEFYNELGGITSAETFVFKDRAAAADPKILASLKRADGIFIMSTCHGMWSLGGMTGSGTAAVLIALGVAPQLHLGILSALVIAATLLWLRPVLVRVPSEEAEEAGSGSKFTIPNRDLLLMIFIENSKIK